MPLLILWMLLVPLIACAKDENLLTLESWGNGAPELSISVPMGYTVQKHKGPDFDVHYIRSKNPDNPSMGIYIGHHPNPFSSQIKGIETRKEGEVILDRNVEWMLWLEKKDGKAFYHCETIIIDAFKGMGEGGVEDLRIHVFMQGQDKKGVDLLKTSTKSLRIVHK